MDPALESADTSKGKIGALYNLYDYEAHSKNEEGELERAKVKAQADKIEPDVRAKVISDSFKDFVQDKNPDLLLPKAEMMMELLLSAGATMKDIVDENKRLETENGKLKKDILVSQQEVKILTDQHEDNWSILRLCQFRNWKYDNKTMATMGKRASSVCRELNREDEIRVVRSDIVAGKFTSCNEYPKDILLELFPECDNNEEINTLDF
jgi:hypothetical protein